MIEQQQIVGRTGSLRATRRLLVWLCLCSVLLLTACTTVRGPTPEEAAHAYFLQLTESSPYTITDWQVHAVRPYGEGQLVLASYTAASTDQPGTLTIAYAEVEQERDSWSVVLGQSAGGTPLPELVMYSTTNLRGTPLVYGRILSPEVYTVEATFDNGTVVRDFGTNGSFALAAPGASRLVELWVLDAQQQIVQRYKQEQVTTAQDTLAP